METRGLRDATSGAIDAALEPSVMVDAEIPDVSIQVDMCPNPEEELCNGQDDDCDGQIDEMQYRPTLYERERHLRPGRCARVLE